MKRLALEITRTSIRALALEGTLAQPRIRRVTIVPLAGEPTQHTLRQALDGL